MITYPKTGNPLWGRGRLAYLLAWRPLLEDSQAGSTPTGTAAHSDTSTFLVVADPLDPPPTTR